MNEVPAAERIKRHTMLDEKTGCLLWTGAVDSYGYGIIRVGSRKTKRTYAKAHRYVFAFHGGQLVKGLTLDHLCRVKNCVNPDHLEQVTFEENKARERAALAVCKNGHPLTVGSNGYRRCLVCRRRTNQEAYVRRRKRLETA